MGMTTKWHGTYLTEDQIVDDLLSQITGDPKAVTRWRDPESWHMRFDGGGPDYAGCLMFAGMQIRNYYGLWHPENPYTEAENAVVTDGIITDPRFPDNVSGRIIGKVKEALG